MTDELKIPEQYKGFCYDPEAKILDCEYSTNPGCPKTCNLWTGLEKEVEGDEEDLKNKKEIAPFEMGESHG